MKLFLVTFVVLALANQIFGAVDYRSLCQNAASLCWGRPHIACEKDRVRVPSGGQMIQLTEAEKQDIVDEHNKLRNNLANGQVEGFGPAVKMGAMVWNNDLADLADLNIRGGKYEHDCHNTPTFPMGGQNLAYIKGYNHGTFDRAAVVKEFKTMINDWFAEYKDANMNIIRDFKSNGHVITHFTGMSLQSNNLVGCAGIWFPEDGTGRVNFGCNYPSLTMQQSPVYVDGPTGSKCQSGRDRKFSGLCSSNEKY